MVVYGVLFGGIHPRHKWYWSSTVLIYIKEFLFNNALFLDNMFYYASFKK